MIDLVDRLRQDALQRQNGLGRPDGPAIEDQAADEIERLRAALEGSPCPYPVIEDKTVAACIRAEHCGCDNREALGPAHVQVLQGHSFSSLFAPTSEGET